MAKISHDDSSWRAHGLAKRYEDWENDPKPPPTKNTKNKCPHEKIVPRKSTRRYGAPFMCAKCRKEFYRDPHAKNINAEKQKRLAAEWCDSEGHEWVWSKFNNLENWNWVTGVYCPTGKPRFINQGGEILEYRTAWDRAQEKYIRKPAKPWRLPKVHQICEMCGLERRGKTRNITPEDL